MCYFRWRQNSELGGEWDSPEPWGQFGFDFRRVWKSREDLMCGKSPDPSGDPVWPGLGGKWEKQPG